MGGWGGDAARRRVRGAQERIRFERRKGGGGVLVLVKKKGRKEGRKEGRV